MLNMRRNKTALNCGPFTHIFLNETVTRIMNEVTSVNRVFFDVTSKPPGTIELE